MSQIGFDHDRVAADFVGRALGEPGTRHVRVDETTVLQEGDLLHVLCHPEDEQHVLQIANAEPQERQS